MISTEPAANKKRIEQLAMLRAVVAFLGEKDQFGWWDCTFLGATGRKYLAITNPRSHVAAGVMAACEAARRVHDAGIVVGSLNLGGSLEMVPNAVALLEIAIEEQAAVLLMPVAARRQLNELLDALWTKINIEFYSESADAFSKALTE